MAEDGQKILDDEEASGVMSQLVPGVKTLKLRMVLNSTGRTEVIHADQEHFKPLDWPCTLGPVRIRHGSHDAIHPSH